MHDFVPRSEPPKDFQNNFPKLCVDFLTGADTVCIVNASQGTNTKPRNTKMTYAELVAVKARIESDKLWIATASDEAKKVISARLAYNQSRVAEYKMANPSGFGVWCVCLK